MQDFFNTLFDFPFTEFITIKIVKVLYGIGILIAGVAAIGFIISAFESAAIWGILALLVSPIIFIIYTVLFRVWLEVVIVLFRISENVNDLAKSKSE